ncbi:MAG: translation elongation factor Ts, partial [Clostridia bacterium]|nr:translation elongation factor Ts [Clostridia bacterium]
KPLYLCREQVPAEEVEHEREIARAQALNEGKPAAIVEKMLTGRIEKYYKDICLVEQVFVKDSALTIKKLVEETGKKLGASIAIREFVRFEMGEGLQKREDNFAEEVMSQVNK